MEPLAEVPLAFLAWAAAIAAPGALLLRWLVRVIGGVQAGYLACFLALLAGIVIAILVALPTTHAISPEAGMVAFGVTLLVVQTVLLPIVIRDATGASALGWGRALGIGLVMVIALPAALYVVLLIAFYMN